MRKAIITATTVSILALAAVAEEQPGAATPPAAGVHFAPRWEQRKDVANPSYLGVYIRDIRPDRMADLKLKDERGAEVTMVDRDGPAGKSGLKEHDVILSFDGHAVEDADKLRKMIQKTPAGTQVSLGIQRDGQPLTLKLQLGDRKDALSKRGSPDMPVPPMDVPGVTVTQHSRRHGLVVETLTPQLAEYFGVKRGQGLLVRSVEKGSQAEAAGFSAGDVILRVGDERIEDVGDWNRQLRHGAGKSVTVTVLRNRAEKTLSLAIPARGSGGSADFDILLPSLDELDLYFEHLGRDIEHDVDKALRSEKLQEFLKLRREDARRLEQELARLRPEFERAAREMQEQIRETLKQHGHVLQGEMD
ncbi:MAG: PDZ domain-containing protein [Candidatus Korobacteraceae bacterium]